MSYSLLSVDPGPVKSGAVVSSVVAARDLRERGKWEHPFGVQPEWAAHRENAEVLDLARNMAARGAWLVRRGTLGDPAKLTRPGAVIPVDDMTDIQSMSQLTAIAAERIAAGYKGAGRDIMDSQLVAGALVDGIARVARDCRGVYVFRRQVESCLGQFVYGGVQGDAEVKTALRAMYGGKTRAIGGGVCKTCRRDDGLRGRKKEPCLNCNADAGGHGALGLENPLGPLAILGNNQHLWDALAVGVTAAMIIGSQKEKES